MEHADEVMTRLARFHSGAQWGKILGVFHSHQPTLLQTDTSVRELLLKRTAYFFFSEQETGVEVGGGGEEEWGEQGPGCRESNGTRLA